MQCARSKLRLGAQWETGAPMPQLLVGLRTFLLFYSPPEKGDPAKDRVGLVEIVGCAAARFGPPNDEALENHPLWAKGCSSTPLIELTTVRGCLREVNSRLSSLGFRPVIAVEVGRAYTKTSSVETSLQIVGRAVIMPATEYADSPGYRPAAFKSMVVHRFPPSVVTMRSSL